MTQPGSALSALRARTAVPSRLWAATVILYFARTITLALPLRRLWRGSGVRLV